jgi:hypothetical protein
LQYLPTHEPDAATWSRIEAQLAADDTLARAVPHLPTHEPDDELWDLISAELDKPAAPLSIVAEAAPAAAEAAPAPVRRLWPARTIRMAVSVAAAVLILVVAWWQRPVAPIQASQPMAAQETISYSEEVVATPVEPHTAASTFDPLATQGVAFIDAHCTSLPTVCQSDEFQELRAQLSELEAEEQRLQQDARRFGSTPELVRTQVKVTTLKASVTRELIDLLIS